MSTEVDQMFSRIADRYDVTNRFISFGTDMWVRRKTLEMADPQPGEDVLDCAAGTGDLTFLFREAVGPEGRVVGTDINPTMLSLAEEKAPEHDAGDIRWKVHDAQTLHHHFEADSFDIVSIAYGVRNVDDPLRALESMARVTRPGGRVVILEFGRPVAPLRPFWWLYNRAVIPVIGGIVSGDPQAYRYLQQTSAEFPCADEFLDLMRQTGAYGDLEATSFMGGVNYIYRGVVR